MDVRAGGGAVLADWGADVIKVEHPETGDPQRGLVTMGIIPGTKGAAGFNCLMEQPNRGKRSIGIDVANPEGLELLYKLVETADVFLTNLLPESCARLKVDVDSIRARNPKIIYARGHGQGIRGEDANRGAYDAAAYFARSGVADALTRGAGRVPTRPAARVRRRDGRPHDRWWHLGRAVQARADRRAVDRRHLAAACRHVERVVRRAAIAGVGHAAAQRR